MESAGKRVTKEPDRLLHRLLQSNKTMAPTTTTIVTPTTTTLITTTSTTTSKMSDNPSVSNSSSQPNVSDHQSDSAVISTLKDLMRGLRIEIKQNSSEMNRKMDELQLISEKHQAQCLQQWGVAETKILKLEENQVNVNTHIEQQININVDNSGRLAYLENEVVTIHSSLARLAANRRQPLDHIDVSQIMQPTSLSSTNIFTGSVPPTQTQASTTHPYFPISSMNMSRFSCSGTQERLQEAVSEFSGNLKILHPEQFLEQLIAYFGNIQLSPSQQLTAAQRRLTGDARVWYNALMPAPKSFDEFCPIFRQRFWSEATQKKIWNEIFRPFQYRSPTGISNHAMAWIAKAKYLSPPVNQLNLVGTIIQHYPPALGIAIRGRGPRTTNELLDILTEFDESPSFCAQIEHQNERNYPMPSGSSNSNNQRNYSDRRGQTYNNNSRQGSRGGHNRDSPPTTSSMNHLAPQVHQIDISGNEPEPRP